MPRSEPLLIALRVLTDIIVNRKKPDPKDAGALKAAAPDHRDSSINDLACEIILRELAKRKAAGAAKT